MNLSVTALGSDTVVELTGFRLIVAGYTGRDVDAVEEHIRELEAIGVPRPESVPAFYELSPELVTTDPDLSVEGSNTSGEVEPVLVRTSGRLYLAVGSDHTDRDIERDSVAASKAACVKPLSPVVVEIGRDFDWDAVRLRSWVDDERYQDGPMTALRATTDVLALVPEDDGGDLVLFGGTVPLLDGGFRPGVAWQVALVLPDGREITHAYRTERKSTR
jgi:hypothetical protein